MAIPDLNDVLLPGLRIIADRHGGLTTDALEKGLGDALSIASSDRAKRQRKSPLRHWQNQVTAAIRELKRAKLIIGPKGGPYRASPQGKAIVLSGRTSLSVREARRLASGKALRTPAQAARDDLFSTASAHGADETPSRIDLDSIRPSTRALVIDLVREAGVDVSDWANYSRGAKHAAVNPKYCYEWAFVQDGELVVLNLWYESMEQDDQGIFQRFSLRASTRNRGKSVWVSRALKLDAAIQTAARGALPIRVIVCDGRMRQSSGKEAVASKVSKRILDPVPWAVTEYDVETSACVIRRGAQPVVILDEDVNGKSRLTVKRLKDAFRSIQRRVSKSQMAMLRGHYYAAGHTASMGMLGACGGYDTYRAANVQYGKMCGMLGDALEFESPGDNVFVLASVLDERDEDGHACWRMDGNVVKALEDLRWVFPRAMPDVSSTEESDTDFGDVSETVRKALVEARVGQGQYRAGVVALWNACSVTDCAELGVMVASHIVPWKASTNAERLDPYNGLLLTPNLDKLFDRYWITFTDKGRILVSRHFDATSMRSLGVTGRESLRDVPERTAAYLQRHRTAFEEEERKRSTR